MRLNSGTRLDRRAALAAERRARGGNWGPWETMSLPDGIPGASGWCRDIRRVHRNLIYVVLVRPLQLPDGTGHHLAIRTASQAEPPWRDKQRIKNELFGDESLAVQVMPAESQLVDAADMYHMWILPEGSNLPFSLMEKTK